MKVVLGIGNPGREYERTRHNIGFRVVDLVARKLGAEGEKKKFKARVCTVSYGSGRALLIKPETYVNLSGESARAALDFYKVAPSDLLVVTDDVNLEFGRLRIRGRGSSGGHNGLESIISHVGTSAFTRVRVGIGREGARGGNLTGHVLGKYSEDEAALGASAEERASAAVIDWLRHGLEACMNRHNGPSPKPRTADGRLVDGEEE